MNKPCVFTSDDILTHIPALRAYGRGLTRHREDADDLVQQTLLKAISNIEKFRPGTNLRAWLFTIMRNSFLTNIYKKNRERPGDIDCASGHAKVYPNHDNYITGQRLTLAINKLPLPYREILYLVLVVGENYEDAAQICGCAVGTVKSRLNRARQMVIGEMRVNELNDLLQPS